MNKFGICVMIIYLGTIVTCSGTEFKELSNFTYSPRASEERLAIDLRNLYLTSLKGISEALVAYPRGEKQSALSDLTLSLSLDVGQNSLSELPDEISKLTTLETLRLDYNRRSPLNLDSIEEVPQSITELSLTHDRLDLLPLWLSKLTNLRDLNIGHNNIDNATALRLLTNLIKLDLSSNPFTTLTDITPLVRLQRLSLKNLPIKIVDFDIEVLTNLQELNLQSSSVQVLPKGLSKLTNLTLLLLYRRAYNMLSSLARLPNLRLEQRRIPFTDDDTEVQNDLQQLSLIDYTTK